MQMEVACKVANTESGWAGERPSSLQITAILLVGTMGMMICGVQPVLLGALVAEGRLSVAGLGWATTAEFLTLGVGMMVAGVLLRPQNLRTTALLSALVTGTADLAMVYENGHTILINRTISGCGEAVLVWIAWCMVARSATPTRWAGLFFACQGVTQLGFAAIVPLTLMPVFGANGGFLAMAGTAMLAGIAAFLLPHKMTDLQDVKQRPSRVFVSLPAVMHLLCVFLISAFQIGVFAYLGPLSIQMGLERYQLGLTISVVLGSAIIGSSMAAVISKLPYYPLFMVCLCINAVILTTLWTLPDFHSFLIVAVCFGFTWLFFMPYQMPMAIRVDPTRKVAVMLTGAQFFGGSVGPLICSFFVSDHDVRGALIAAGGCFLAAFMISSLLHLRLKLDQSLSVDRDRPPLRRA